jgi:hypothetical protein
LSSETKFGFRYLRAKIAIKLRTAISRDIRLVCAGSR